MKKLFFPAIITALALAIYWNSLGNSYVWDDKLNFSENPNIRNFSLVFKSLFSPKYSEVTNERYYRPVVTLSYALEYQAWGLRPAASHAVNVIFHALNGILLFIFLTYLVPSRQIAAASSLLFISHPVQTNAAAFINGRMEIFCAFFFLLSLILFLKSRESSSKAKLLLLLSLTTFILALMSKETALILPLSLLLMQLCFTGTGTKKTIATVIPYVIVATAYLAFRLFFIGGSALQMERPLPAWSTFLMMIKVVALYIKLLVFPARLCADYFSIPVSASFIEKEILLSSGLIIAALAVAVYGALRNRLISFSISWFFISLLPVMNIVPLLTFASEKFLYMPSVGFCIFLSTVMLRLSEWRNASRAKFIFWLTVIFILGLYSYQTVNRNVIWKNELSLFRNTVQCSPHSASAHVKYGNELCRVGNCRESLREYEKALALQTDAAIYCNMGEAYGRLGKYEKAAVAFQQCLELDPENPAACERLLLALKLSGKLQDNIHLCGKDKK
ncbi:MAG: tetratricopeptide repeat protein [bacterium]